MSDKKIKTAEKINEKTPDRNANGTSVLLRLSSNMGSELRRISRMEERSITTVVTRALRAYFKAEHNLDIPVDMED